MSIAPFSGTYIYYNCYVLILGVWVGLGELVFGFKINNRLAPGSFINYKYDLILNLKTLKNQCKFEMFMFRRICHWNQYTEPTTGSGMYAWRI